MFTLETIRRRCVGQDEYIAGQFLVPDTELDVVQSFWKGEVTLKAHVKEKGSSYEVRVSLLNGEFHSWHCSCMACLSGLCRHIAAASITYYSIISRKTRAELTTSPEMQKILRDYGEQGITRLMQMQHEGKVRLIPILSVGNGSAQVSFRIGSLRKSYILKDLSEFYYHMQAKETVQYGKFLNFVHAEWSFEEENQPLLFLVMEMVEREINYYRQYHPYIPTSGFRCRELCLSRELADRLLSLYLGESIEMVDGAGQTRMVEVVEDNPKLHLRLKREQGGCRLFMDEIVSVIEGDRCLYVVENQRIYCTSQAFTSAMRVFLREAGRSGKRLVYEISRHDMPKLCGQLLPCIVGYVDLDTGGIDLDMYTPKPVKAEFSFDICEDGVVACEEKLSYEEFSFNPVKGNSVPVHICRDYPGEYRIRQTVEQYFKYYDLDSGKLLLYNEEEIFCLLDEGMDKFMQLGEVYLSEAFKAVRILSSPNISVGVSIKGNMLELIMDSGGFLKEELEGLLKNYHLKKKYYRLKKGEFVRIEDTALESFFEMAKGLKLSAGDLVKEKISVPVYRAMYLDEVLGERKAIKSEEYRRLVLACRETCREKVPEGFAGTLRGYQETGFRWMKTLSQCGFGGILADEMGLGKTIQVIALLLSAKKELEKPALIICPASLVYNWENELHRFAPELSVLVVSGSEKERMQSFSEQNVQIYITSYDLLRRDIEQYTKKEFSYQIIDEAQTIKNHSTQGARAVKAICAAHRFALTGTPIENRLSELWSIFDYLMKGYLYSYSYFREELEIPIVKEKDNRAERRLQMLIRPFVLRRLKKDVLRDLPEKLETVVYSRMEKEQDQLYRAYAAKVREELLDSTPEEFQRGKIQVLAALTRLRQLCCDPALCYDNYSGGSAKLATLTELMEEGIGAGHRFLVFSQFTSMLDRIQKELERRGITSFQLTGATPKLDRLSLAERFNAGEKDAFLISLKAGGTGLNLTGADMVIHYDPWWNLAAQNQATDRAHRIGQTQKVTVIKLVVQGTIEESIIRLQESKHRLAEQIIGGAEGGLSSVTQEKLLEILNAISK